MTRVLLVCLGNICRSPMAQRVLCAVARERGHDTSIEIESAGTHAGGSESTDARALASLARAGYDAGARRARRVLAADFENFDLVLAMDRDNLAALRQRCPSAHQHKLRLWLDFVPGAAGRDVPDPYYGDEPGFDRVLALCEAGARGVMDVIERDAGAPI
jgi:protein-tyrosine phosphatase